MSAVLLTGAKLLIPIIAKHIARRIGVSEKRAQKAAEAIAEPIHKRINEAHLDPKQISSETIKSHIDAYMEGAPDIVRFMEIWASASASDAEKGGLNALWRPLNGIVFACEMIALVVAGIASAYFGKAEPFQQVVFAITPLLTAQAGFLGWYAHLRSAEKKAMM